MEISVVILRKDLLALNFYLFPRLKSNWILFALMATGMFFFIFITKRPGDVAEISVTILAALVAALVATLVCMIINSIAMQLMLGKSSGVLGLHHYSLSTLGLI